MIYAVVFEDAADGSVGAYVPDIPGVATVGADRADAMQLLDQAVQWHVEAMIEDGEPLPEPKEALTPGQWAIVLDRTYVDRFNEALSVYLPHVSNKAPFWLQFPATVTRVPQTEASVA